MVTALVRIPLESGGYLVAELDRGDIPADSVTLASPDPSRATAQVTQTLESSLHSLRPALVSISTAFRDLAPSTVQLEFGVKLGGETGIILAKGTAEVHFTVRVSWDREVDAVPPSSGS